MNANGSLQSAEAFGIRFAGKLGLNGANGVIKQLRSIPAGDLADAWFRMVHEGVDGVGGSSGPWMINQLIVDGHVLPESPGDFSQEGNNTTCPL